MFQADLCDFLNSFDPYKTVALDSIGSRAMNNVHQKLPEQLSPLAATHPFTELIPVSETLDDRLPIL